MSFSKKHNQYCHLRILLKKLIGCWKLTSSQENFTKYTKNLKEIQKDTKKNWNVTCVLKNCIKLQKGIKDKKELSRDIRVWNLTNKHAFPRSGG